MAVAGVHCWCFHLFIPFTGFFVKVNGIACVAMVLTFESEYSVGHSFKKSNESNSLLLALITWKNDGSTV